MNKPDQNDIIELLNEISKYPEHSLLEKMLSYCEMNDIDPKEFGDIFADSEQFKKQLWINCIENNYIRDDSFQEKLNLTEEIDEW